MDASIAELYASLQRDKNRRQAKNVGLVIREPEYGSKMPSAKEEYGRRPQNPGLKKRNVRLQKIATKYKSVSISEHPAEEALIKRFMKKLPPIMSYMERDHYDLQGGCI